MFKANLKIVSESNYMTIEKVLIQWFDTASLFPINAGKPFVPVSYNKFIPIENGVSSLSGNILEIEVQRSENEELYNFFYQLEQENTINPLVRKYTAFQTMDEMVNAHGSFIPKLRSITGLSEDAETNEIERKELRKIANYYDAKQKEKGSTKRANQC